MSIEDAFEDSLLSALPEIYQPIGVIDMGAEYFDKELHVTLKAELDRYGIPLNETVSNSMNKCWTFSNGTSLSMNDVPTPLDSTAERDEYNRVMDVLEFHMQKFRNDQDYRRPRKMFGFTTDELEMLDISFSDYVSNVLNATGAIKEYVLSRFHHPHTYSCHYLLTHSGVSRCVVVIIPSTPLLVSSRTSLVSLECVVLPVTRLKIHFIAFKMVPRHW